MTEAPQVPTLTLDACVGIVQAVINASKVPTADAAKAAEPNWDAMANSFASLSVALTIGSIILALITLVSAAGWGYIVKQRAEEEARSIAKACAEQLIAKWLAEDAPGIVRRKVDMLGDASLGAGDDAKAADEMGEVAG